MKQHQIIRTRSYSQSNLLNSWQKIKYFKEEHKRKVAQREKEASQQIKQQQIEAKRRRLGKPPIVTSHLLNFKIRKARNCGIFV
mmetsp:Transcript_81/g.84  ORF Transcript_81/g.84 Transcript_81/m.84 type:complete len:84 (+) Transcript_81:113-364(+)